VIGETVKTLALGGGLENASQIPLSSRHSKPGGFWSVNWIKGKAWLEQAKECRRIKANVDRSGGDPLRELGGGVGGGGHKEDRK